MPSSKKGGARTSRPPTLATVETHTDDRDACAVAVAVRELVKLARQQAPEGARIAPMHTPRAAGITTRAPAAPDPMPQRLRPPAGVGLLAIKVRMPAPRKPRAKTEKELRTATVCEALDELSHTFNAELGERAPAWSEAECQRLYRVVGISYRQVYERSQLIFAAYEDLRRTILTIRSLAEDPTNETLVGYGREMLNAMAKHALPLSESLFSAHKSSRFFIISGLNPGLSTERQWFIFGADGLYDTPLGEAKPWGLERSPTARELALVALVAGDFPVVRVGENGDTPASVIKKMTSTMATERRRLWKLLTNGESSGPPLPDGQFDEEHGDYG